MNPFPKSRLSSTFATIHHSRQQHPEQRQPEGLFEPSIDKIQRHHSLFEAPSQVDNDDLPHQHRNSFVTPPTKRRSSSHQKRRNHHNKSPFVGSKSAPTKSIPIDNNNNKHPLKRTGSELRLREEEEMADFRDFVFYTRLVEGILARYNDKDGNGSKNSDWLQKQNDACLAHIIGTRNGCMDDRIEALSSSSPSSCDNLGFLPDYHHTAAYNNNGSDPSSSSLSVAADEIFAMDW